MIEYCTGDMFANTAVEALTNTVNCVGVMGKGLALQFKQRMPPYYFQRYAGDCKYGLYKPGHVITFFNLASDHPKWVFNFTTKNHWRNPSRLEWIKSGLEDLVSECYAHRITRLAIPALGCTNGGLNWDDVRPLIEAAFKDNPVQAMVYPPQ
jgi:O-acetyl-ADP-ribose deacetylase (regulator of RNase III)